MTTQKLLTGMHRVRKLYETRLIPVLRDHDLTGFEADVLGFLSNNPDMDTANHIVEYRMLAKANVSKAVDKLESRGFVSLRRDDADRRRVHIQLTAAAMPALEDILKAQAWFIDRLADGFSPEERILFTGFLDRINENAITATEDY